LLPLIGLLADWGYVLEVLALSIFSLRLYHSCAVIFVDGLWLWGVVESSGSIMALNRTECRWRLLQHISRLISLFIGEPD